MSRHPANEGCPARGKMIATFLAGAMFGAAVVITVVTRTGLVREGAIERAVCSIPVAVCIRVTVSDEGHGE